MSRNIEQEVRDERAMRFAEAAKFGGGVLKIGEGVKFDENTQRHYNKANEESKKFADKNGNVDPNIQTIFARMYGLI